MRSSDREDAEPNVCWQEVSSRNKARKDKRHKRKVCRSHVEQLRKYSSPRDALVQERTITQEALVGSLMALTSEGTPSLED